MAWLDIERKAEAIMQAAERNIRASESVQADMEPPWDGFCGLVRICDDAELKERGVVRAVARPAPPQQVVPQRRVGSTLQSAEKAVTRSPAVPGDWTYTRIEGAKAPTQVTGRIENAPSTVIPTSTQPHCAVQPILISAAAASSPLSPVASSLNAAFGPVAAVDGEQQQQQHAPTLQQHAAAQQQQPISKPADEAVSIASCLNALAGSSAVDPLDDLTATVSSPHREAPSWVMSYLLGHDGSDSDDDGVNDGNDKADNSGSGGESGRGTGESNRISSGSAALERVAVQCSREAVHAAPADIVAVTAARPTLISADPADPAAPAAPAAATSDVETIHHPAEPSTLDQQIVSESDRDRVEQLLQEAFAAAESSYQQEQQQLDRAATGGGAATVKAHGGTTAAAAAGGALAAVAASVIAPAEAAAAAAGAATQDHLAQLDEAALAVENLICVGSDSSSDGIGCNLPTPAAADGMQTAAHETTASLAAAADAVELQAKHFAGAAAPISAVLSHSSTEGRQEDSLRLSAPTVADRYACSTGSTAPDEVAELLAAVADAAALEAKHAAPVVQVPAALREVPAAGVLGVSVPAVECAVPRDSSCVSLTTLDLRPPHGAGSRIAADAEVAELLAAAADEAALHSKHGTSSPAAATAGTSSPAAATAGGVKTPDSGGSEDEADRLVASVADAAVLDNKHGASAATDTKYDTQQQAAAERDEAKSEPGDDEVLSASGSDSDNESDSYNSEDEEEALDLLEELPEVPSHVAVVPSKAARQNQGSRNNGSKHSNVAKSSGRHSNSRRCQ